MTESDLERMLGRGVLRVRLNAALRGACIALCAALAASALFVAAARAWPMHEDALLSSLWAAPLLVVAATVAAFWAARPSALRVALQLDQSAGLAEHLTTWEDLRRRAASTDPQRQAFVRAQRQATLRRTEGLRVGRHLPLRLPEWSRGLLLGVLALGCALLMPRSETARAQHAPGAKAHPRVQAAGAPGETPERFGAQANSAALKFNPLTPTEMLKLKLAALSDAPEERKLEALELLEKRRGSLALSELQDELRQLREMLRAQAGLKEGEQAEETGKSAEGAADDEHPREIERRFTEALPPPARAEDLVGVAQERFPDVAAALERYYGSAP